MLEKIKKVFGVTDTSNSINKGNYVRTSKGKTGLVLKTYLNTEEQLVCNVKLGDNSFVIHTNQLEKLDFIDIKTNQGHFRIHAHNVEEFMRIMNESNYYTSFV